MEAGATFAYVACADSREIHVFRLDPNSGKLTAVQQITVAGKVMPMALSPDRRFLFAALRSEPYAVASFAIDAINGRLTYLADAPLPASMATISVDRSGRFLFGASTLGSVRSPKRTDMTGEVITVSAIGRHGFVQPAQQILRTGPKMHAINADPSNRHVIATSCDGDCLVRCRFDAATGALSLDRMPPVQVKPKAGPRHFVFHPNGRGLYLLNETDASVYVYDYDVGTGGLKEAQIVNTLPHGTQLEKEHPNAHAADIHITPDGRFLYASVRITNTLAAFKVDVMSGRLSAIGHFGTEKGPRAFNIDPSGRHLLALGGSSHIMAAYRIDAESGSLIENGRYTTGKYPNWVEIARL